MLLSSSWVIFIRAIVFSSSPRVNFSLFFVSTNFSIHSYLVQRVKTEKQLYYHQDWEVSIMLYYWLWYNKAVTFFSYSIRNYNAMTSKIRKKDNLWRKSLGEILKGFLCYCWDLNMSWLEHFPKFNNKRGVWNKNVLGGKLKKKNWLADLQLLRNVFFTWPSRGKVKYELRVTSSNPRVTSSNPRVTSSNSLVTSSKPWVRRRVSTSLETKSTSSKIKSASWEIKSTR